MHHVIVQNGKDLEVLMDHFARDPRVDPDRCGGVTGVSTGGFATFYAAANNAAGSGSRADDRHPGLRRAVGRRRP